jgi:putative oxidoreductase
MQRIYDQFYSGRVGVALLLLRFIVGLAFIFHGWPLVNNVTGFAGSSKVPVWLAAVAAYGQFIGGILLILGLLTPIVAAVLAIEMLVALFKVHFPAGDPFVNPAGRSYEVAAVFLFTMLSFLLAGPGAYSLDALLMRGRGSSVAAFGRRRGVA